MAKKTGNNAARDKALAQKNQKVGRALERAQRQPDRRTYDTMIATMKSQTPKQRRKSGLAGKGTGRNAVTGSNG